jgi:hypothetical protein
MTDEEFQQAVRDRTGWGPTYWIGYHDSLVDVLLAINEPLQSSEIARIIASMNGFREGLLLNLLGGDQ